MIVVHKVYDGGADPVLAYDAEREELWGHPEYWESNLELVGLSEDEFARFFDSHTLIAGEADEDPFEGMPNAAEQFRNYPPGSEEIPDLTTPEPRPATDQEGGGGEGEADVDEKTLADHAYELLRRGSSDE